MHEPPGRLARLYARCQQLADAGWGQSVVFGWGLLQGVVFPGVADLFFLPLAIARPERAYRLALIAAAGTIIGSIVLYWAGAELLTLLQGPLARLFNLTPASLERYRSTLATYGAWAILASTMSPLSTKLTSIASGAIGVPFPLFLLALATGRCARTLGFAWLVRNGGSEAVRKYVNRGTTEAGNGGS